MNSMVFKRFQGIFYDILQSNHIKHARIAITHARIAITHASIAITHGIAITHARIAITHARIAITHARIAITHVCLFLCINIGRVPWKMFAYSAFGLVFKQLPRDPV